MSQIVSVGDAFLRLLLPYSGGRASKIDVFDDVDGGHGGSGGNGNGNGRRRRRWKRGKKKMEGYEG